MLEHVVPFLSYSYDLLLQLFEVFNEQITDDDGGGDGADGGGGDDIFIVE